MVCEELRKNGGHHHILITQFIVLDLLIFSYVITTFWAEFMAAKIFRDVITYDWAAVWVSVRAAWPLQWEGSKRRAWHLPKDAEEHS